MNILSRFIRWLLFYHEGGNRYGPRPKWLWDWAAKEEIMRDGADVPSSTDPATASTNREK